MGCEHCDCYHYRSEFIRSFIEHEVCCDCKVSDEELNGEGVPLCKLQWQPIETAPKDKVLLLYAASYIEIGWWDEDEENWWARHATEYPSRPTHWMPLPIGPKE